MKYCSRKLNLLISILATLSLSACQVGSNGGGNENADQSGTSDKSLQIRNGNLETDPEINARFPLIVQTLHGINQGYVTTCTSEILDKNTILTAAHCLLTDTPAKIKGDTYSENIVAKPSDIKVILSKDLTKPVSYSQAGMNLWQSYNAEKIYIHPDAFRGVEVSSNGELKNINYNDINDIAIIKLATPLDDKYKSVIISPDSKSDKIVSGYGLNPADNNGTVLRTGMIFSSTPHLETDPYFHLAGQDTSRTYGNTVSCTGDSGGPAYSREYTTGNIHNVYLYGIVSLGDAGANCIENKSGVSTYMNVWFYREWINGGYLTSHL